MGNYDELAGRRFEVLDRIEEHARTRIEIECPHCGAQFWAYVWSMSGGGKKCPKCGAMHLTNGRAYPVKRGAKK